MNLYATLRYRRGITQTELVEATGLSRGTIYNLEQQSAVPSAPTARKLADFYGLSIEQIMGSEPLPQEQAA